MPGTDSFVNQSSNAGDASASATSAVVIRRAGPGDDAALRRLAELDSAPVPAAPILLAEVGGELQAAISLAGGRALADPFRPTAELSALLEMRAAQLRGGGRHGLRLLAQTAVGRGRRGLDRRPRAV